MRRETTHCWQQVAQQTGFSIASADGTPDARYKTMEYLTFQSQISRPCNKNRAVRSRFTADLRYLQYADARRFARICPTISNPGSPANRSRAALLRMRVLRSLRCLRQGFKVVALRCGI